MSEYVDYLFLIEHEDREGKLIRLLSDKLSKQGLSSKVLSIEFHMHLLGRYKANVIVLPYAIDSSRYPLSLFQSRLYSRTKFVSLNWEQLLSKSNQEFKSPKCEFVKNRIHHLAWSNDFKEFLMTSGVSRDKIIVIGNPNVELLYNAIISTRKDLKNAKSNLGINTDKKIIFFPMNYGWAFASDKIVLGKIKQGYDHNIAWQYRDYSNKCLEKFIEFIVSLSKSYKDELIVIRPHPSISSGQYKQVFSKLGFELPNNLIITKSNTVKEWIAISDIVGSSWSTTVWDCYHMSIPAFLFTPIDRPSWLNTEWNDKVLNLSSVEQFSQFFEMQNNGGLVKFDYIEGIFNWLYEVNNVKNNDLEYGFISDFNFKVSLYKTRCLLRCISAKYLGGVLVSKGSMRDYFNANDEF